MRKTITLRMPFLSKWFIMIGGITENKKSNLIKIELNRTKQN